MIIVYPALFTRTKDHFLNEVPDLNILSQSPGGDFANAINVARDAIGLRCICIEDGASMVILKFFTLKHPKRLDTKN